MQDLTKSLLLHEHKKAHDRSLFLNPKKSKYQNVLAESMNIQPLHETYLLLSFQFRSYVEPLVVMFAIPMCLIGVIWGHILMGLYFTLPSVLGFVSLSGVVVNDSILLVEFIKTRRRTGVAADVAACAASRLRFRAVMLTSVTTVAGMLPLLSETSQQAQILVPLATSIVFGLGTSTLLVLFVIPALYTIVDDLGFSAPVESDL